MLAVVVLHVVPAALFALIHGAMLYRVRGILIFIALCLVIGNIFENVGVLTGFPYGHYYFTDLMGPKLFAVPVFLGLAYVGMAYLSWILARLILGFGDPLVGSRIVTLPLTAAFIMVAWDLAMDPIWGTVLHAWIWVRGGAYFAFPSATSWAGISRWTSSTSCSPFIFGGAHAVLNDCRPAIGIWRWCFTQFPRPETCRLPFRGLDRPCSPMLPACSGR